jgi:uncharacterized membrane-anchored protein YitT (DUF2179 family)
MVKNQGGIYFFKVFGNFTSIFSKLEDDMNKIREYLLITLGVFIVGFSISVFLIPSKLAVGGITGLAMVINNMFPVLSVAKVLWVLNIILFIIGFISIGKQFGAKTIYASFLLNGVISVFEGYFKLKEPIVDDILLNLVFGIVIGAIGLAVLFYQNASTGGTDIIAKILNKYFHTDIGKSLLMADVIVTILAIGTFGMRLGLYAVIGVVINGYVIDGVIEGLNRRIQLNIVSRRNQEIIDFIHDELDRSATLYSAQGAYSGDDMKVVVTVMNKREYIRLIKYIKSIDRDAFITVSNVVEVLGEGFKLFE